MERCKTCKKYTGTPKPVGLGEKCNFNIITSNSRTTHYRVATGKLYQIWAGGVYGVMYRRTLYRTGLITHTEDPSPISIAITGRCSCTVPAHDGVTPYGI